MSHNPKKLRRAVLKEELVALLGDPKSAMLLNQMIYWSERVRDFDDFIGEEIKRAEAEAVEINIEPSNGWFYKTVTELGEEIMGLIGRDKVLEMLEALINAGYLSRRKNPRYKWDRTNQYRVNIAAIQRDLMRIGYALEGYRVDITREAENAPAAGKSDVHGLNLDVPRSGNRTLKVGESTSNTKDYIQRLDNVPRGKSKNHRWEVDTDTRTRARESVPGGGTFDAARSENEADKKQAGQEREPEKRRTGRKVEAERFTKFWEAYPKKRAKGCAEKAWRKINPDEPLLEAMLSAIEQARQSKEWHVENGRYIPNPATWLNQRRWEDEYDVQATSKYAPNVEAALRLVKKYKEEEAHEENRNGQVACNYRSGVPDPF